MFISSEPENITTAQTVPFNYFFYSQHEPPHLNNLLFCNYENKSNIIRGDSDGTSENFMPYLIDKERKNE